MPRLVVTGLLCGMQVFHWSDLMENPAVGICDGHAEKKCGGLIFTSDNDI